MGKSNGQNQHILVSTFSSHENAFNFFISHGGTKGMQI